MPIDAVKIPQNVQIEDKVIGPISLRQLLILGIGGGFSYMLYTLVARAYGEMNIPLTVVLWTPAVIAAAFALVNINDLSLTRICFLLLEKLQKPSLRTWAPRSGISITIRTSTAKKDEEAAKKPVAPEHSAQEQIAELTRVVDTTSAVVSQNQTSTQPVTSTATVTPSVPGLPAVASASAEAKVGLDPDRKIMSAVRPDDIRVDSPSPALSPLSDLSVFRDVLPPNASWPS